MAKTPEAKWHSVKKEGHFEIRLYDSMIVAEVITSGERYNAINIGFRILASYIFGQNTTQKQIITPDLVSQQQTSINNQKIPMTAPVIQENIKQSNEWAIRFVMPENYSLETLPLPNDKRISLLELPSYKAAVIRFSGLNSNNNLKRHEQLLFS